MSEEFESYYMFDNRVYLSESKCFLFITDSGRIHLFPEGGIADKEIGGCGVTQRTLAQSERMLPGLISTITQTIDTIGSEVIILGNGLSLISEELISIYGYKINLTIVDIIDYDLLIIDLRNVLNKFNYLDNNQKETISDFIDRCQKILQLRNQDRIKCVCAKIGEKNFEIKKGEIYLGQYDLVINIMGPSFVTLSTQLRLLNQSGVLITTLTDLCNVVGFSGVPVFANKNRVGQIIERTGV